MKKIVLLFMMVCALSAALCACAGNNASDEGTELTVFNYSEYLDPEMIAKFTKETGIKINYEEATTPEEMYTKFSSGAISYDLLCTSDYMLKRLIDEGRAQEIDRSAIANFSNIDPKFSDLSKSFDPDGKYTVPYFWGTVGILYNTKETDGPVDSWDDLFSGKYRGNIIMQDSMRDSFMVALKYLGYSLNTKDEAQIREAAQLLKDQKSDVESYLVDEARDEVVAGNAVMAVVYSGEAYLGHQYNEDLAYVVPKEGSNLWIDSWIVTDNCKNKDAAIKFLDFLCREDVANANFEYIYYSTPNTAVVQSMDEDLKNDPAIIPSDDSIKDCEVYEAFDEKTTQLYNELWKEIKAE
ncbi:MAG: spermidine/putrescine ABC transporter substrate-binding protein [Lachnospiraceae bacterium]|nr:spermidine/putrescine ABC transporter substrate-binding protein [Lachnospiraceae bacterium]